MESQKSWNANIYNIFITLGCPPEVSEILLKMTKRNYFISNESMEERRIFDIEKSNSISSSQLFSIYRNINYEIKQVFNRHAPYLIKRHMIVEFSLNPQLSFMINNKKVSPGQKWIEGFNEGRILIWLKSNQSWDGYNFNWGYQQDFGIENIKQIIIHKNHIDDMFL